jgi:hypothetical protein
MKGLMMKIVANSLVFMFFIACNPIPKKDIHPELPYLKDLLKDQSKFTGMILHPRDAPTQLYFLKSDKIVLPSISSDAPIKIVDIHNKVLFEKVYNWNMPFYIDSVGNIYCNNMKYSAPDYKTEVQCAAVYIADSTRAFSDKLDKQFVSTDDVAKQMYNDSVSLKLYTEYEKQLLVKYGINPNNADEIVYKIVNNQLVVWNNKGNLFVIDAYLKPTSKVEYFDESVLLEYRNSGGHFGGPYPVYLNYHKLKNGIKFKEEDNPWPEIISLEGKDYIYFNKCGLFLIK